VIKQLKLVTNSDQTDIKLIVITLGVCFTLKIGFEIFMSIEVANSTINVD